MRSRRAVGVLALTGLLCSVPTAASTAAEAEKSKNVKLIKRVNYWSAYWYDGRIWANARVRGLDVFTVKGLEEK